MFIKNLKIFPSVLAFLVISCGPKAQKTLTLTSGEIVGGQKVTDTKEFSSVVGIVKNGRIMCSGNLISKKKIYTAAHCLTNFEYNSKAQVQNMIVKVLDFITKDGSIENYEDFNKLPFEEKRQLFINAATNIIRKESKQIKIYFGLGGPGGKEEGLSIVEKVNLSNEAISYAVSLLMSNTILAIDSDRFKKYNAS